MSYTQQESYSAMARDAQRADVPPVARLDAQHLLAPSIELRYTGGERDRTERVLHGLDGIRGEVTRDAFLAVAELLRAALGDLQVNGEVDYLLGLDAGGFIPTLALSEVTGIPYRLAWKLHLALPERREFAEPHAQRTSIYTYGLLAGSSCVVVDDEITTGQTLDNLLALLEEADVKVLAILVLVEREHPAEKAFVHRGVPYVALSRV